jgi:hypothetical protein
VSSTIWTPRALAAKASRHRAELWRAVEAQHIASTMALVDSQAEQDTLESLLEHTKPALPPAAAGLHYLLFTPFRYPPTGHGSRFRSATDSGVFYGADQARTACAELGYWRWRFVADSEGLSELGPVAHTLFLARVDGSTIDLREKLFLKDKKAWTDPASYEATQALAANARRAGIDVIRYESVRDPEKGGCGAVLEPAAFMAPRRPLREQTWFLTVNRTSSAWRRDKESFEFRWA